MQTDQLLTFGSYRLDPHTGQLWRSKQEVRLTGKASAVLRYLVARDGQVVTKDELFAAVWPETVVSDAALTSCMQELRKALKDDPKQPRYLKTIHRRGFQFIGSLQAPGLPEPLTAPVPQQSIERKLVAILSADVQGYSRLMSEDELATIRTLTAYREAMTAIITRHRGRVVDAPGDNLLAEFPSAVDAVQAAVVIQQDFKRRNAELPLHRQMHYRIGINVGDVVVEGGRIYGDGINIAARLEALADGGGICLSRAVHEQVKNKVALTYEYVGERTVKNIAEPVQVYRIKVESAAASQAADTALLPTTPPVQRSRFNILNPRSAIVMVGRENELWQLHEWFNKALHGQRQVVFVTGEPGIGKTTVVETFLGQVAGEEELWIGRGQCVEHYGMGEAYLPVLEALGRLCREADGHDVIALLRHQAPTWLVQMPAVVSPAELEELQRRTAGVTQERMLRELAEALEALTAERALILRLEDLHWSDYSTLDLLSVLARRQEAARLLILGTYRPVEVLTRDHPLKGIKQELQLHRQCEELALEFLSEAAVAEYLVQRFGAPSPASAREGRGEGLSQASLQRLAHLIHQRTDGNALFMVTVVNDLIAQGVLTKTNGDWELRREVRERTLGMPVNLRQLIEQQLERVRPEERQVLAAASVAGAEFSAAAVAVGAEQSAEAVEAHCEALVRREQFLRVQGTSEWPDGTVATRYQFLHALYQEVLYERIPAARRSRLHRLIGDRTEAAYGTQAREIAAELAVHFEQGRDYRRAIQYLQHAGENAVQRSANQEAITLLTKGLELLKTLPDTSERIQQELTLQIALNDALVPAKGYTAPEVEKAVTRARELCQQTEETPQLSPVLWRLWLFYLNRSEYQTARELAEQRMRLAQSAQDRYLLSLAHMGLGVTLYWLGELASARPHVEQALALYDPQQHPHSTVNPADPRVDYLSYAAFTLWHLGYPDQGLKRSQEALALAEELSHPYSLAFALWSAAWFHLLRREGQFARERAEAVMTLSTEQGFPYGLAVGTMVRSWALAEQGQVQEGIAQMRKSRAPYPLALLAEAYGKVGQVEEGLTVLAKALAQVEKTGERISEAELYRIKGELLLNAERVANGEEARPQQNDERNTKKKERASSPIHHSSFIIHHSAFIVLLRPKRAF